MVVKNRLKKLKKYLIISSFIMSFSVNVFAVNDTTSTGNNTINNTVTQINNTVNNVTEQVNNTVNQIENTTTNTNYNNVTNTNSISSITNTSTTTNNTTSTEAKTVKKSDNANLSSLKLDREGMEPNFDVDIIEYNLTIGKDVDRINVDAEVEDEKAEVKVKGNENLQEEENLIEIIVTAENGDTKTYSIHVTKKDDEKESNAYLKKLRVKEFNIYPSFKNDIYSYNLMINKNLEDIENLQIIAEPEDKESKVEVKRDGKLEYGDNLIRVIVTSKDEKEKKEYIINAYIQEKPVEIQETNYNEAYILIAILGILILISAICVVKKRK